MKGAGSIRPACSSSSPGLWFSFEGPAASLVALETCKEIARRSHIEGLVTDAGGLAVRTGDWAGEWDTALAECGELAPIMDRMGDAWGLAIVRYVWSLRCWAAAMPFERSPFRRWRSRWRATIRSAACRRSNLVAAAAARHGIGDAAAAFALLEECRALLRGKGDTVFVYLLPLAVRTAVAAGNADLARSLAEVVVPVLPFSRHVDATLRAQVRRDRG